MSNFLMKVLVNLTASLIIIYAIALIVMYILGITLTATMFLGIYLTMTIFDYVMYLIYLKQSKNESKSKG